MDLPSHSKADIMSDDSSYPISIWRQVFEGFLQVIKVQISFDTDSLELTVKGRKDVLKASAEELDDKLHKFKGNPREVANSFLREHGVIVYYPDTLVGFFDIHAYSAFIDNKPFEECIGELSNLIINIKNLANTYIGDAKLDHWILSDSLILVVDTNLCPLFSGSLEVFFSTCSIIMETAMKLSFPLRGAIGGGDFYNDGELLVSSALVDAARYEKTQNWLGAVLSPNALRIIDKAKKSEIAFKGNTNIDFSNEHFNHYIRHGKIPWKPEESIEKPAETFYIKPYSMAEPDWASKYLPLYFKDEVKVDNSHILYGDK